MPHSSPIFDEKIEKALNFLQPKNLLDIGAGAGKYGKIVKDLNKGVKIVALEIEKDYINKFKLEKIYDEVWNMPANKLIRPSYYEKNFDVILMGDVIEHMKKSEGIDLINFLIYRSKWIIIKFPHMYVQNSVEGYNSEAHISVWSDKDFENFERTRLYEEENIRMIILKGYLEDTNSLNDLGTRMESR